MKAKPMKNISFVFTLVTLGLFSSYSNALTVVQNSDISNQFLFVENQEDDNYFVTPVNTLNPRLTGASAWTLLKNTRQRSLAYVDPGNNFVAGGYYIDMWEENSPISYPYTTHRCIDNVDNCNMDTGTSIFSPPPLVDSKGFYGIRAAYGWSHAEISSSFFSYLRNMNVGETLTRTMHYCRTTAIYDPTKGERCADQTTGNWASRTVHQTKESHLTLKRTNSFSHLMIDTAGNPIILPGSLGCEAARLNSRNGVICEFLQYDFRNSGGNSYSNISIDTMLMKGLTVSSTYDLQKSTDKSYWRGHGYTLNLNYLNGRDTLYLFMSDNLLKQIISQNVDDISAKSYFKFIFYNSLSPESGYYQLSGTSEIMIYPREYVVTIRSSDGQYAPYKSGRVGLDVLNFNYDIIKSAPVSSSSFDISISQDIPGTWHNGYCLFYPDNSKSIDQAVPIPAYISFRQQSGSHFRQLIDCDNGTISLKNNNILESKATIEAPVDGTTDTMYTRFYNLDLEFDLKDPSVYRTTDDSFWEGEVHQSGTITIKATWND